MSKGKNPTYTQNQIKWLVENVEGKDWKTITEQFNKEFGTNKTLLALKSYCNRKLKVYCGRKTTFSVGGTVWNKGISKEEWESHFSQEKLERIRKTQLKKGHKITPTSDIGSTMDVGGVVIVKTGKGSYGGKKGWERQDFIEYEKQTGIRPEKYSVMVHLDGNTMNCDLDNLYLTDRKVCSSVHRNYFKPTKDVITYKTALMNETLAYQCEIK